MSVVNEDCLMEFMSKSTQYLVGHPNKKRMIGTNVGYQLYTSIDVRNIPESIHGICSFLWHTEAPSLATGTGRSYKIKPLDLKNI